MFSTAAGVSSAHNTLSSQGTHTLNSHTHTLNSHTHTLNSQHCHTLGSTHGNQTIGANSSHQQPDILKSTPDHQRMK